MPHPLRARAGNRLWLEQAFRLRQVDQVERHPFGGEDAFDHRAVETHALKTRLDSRTATSVRVVIEHREHAVVDLDRDVVFHSFDVGLNARPQSRI